MTNDKKLLALIGRFQPTTNAHVELIKQSIEPGEDLLIVIGSAYAPRTVKNPFTAQERASLLEHALRTAGINCGIHIVYVRDQRYSPAQWISDVQVKISMYPTSAESVTLLGHHKDSSSHYLDDFPDYGYREGAKFGDNLSATTIRDGYFEHGLVFDDVPLNVKVFMRDFKRTPEYDALRTAWTDNKLYQASWSRSPYPPTFITGDAVVIQSSHVLLVKRRDNPGKGLLALPGGFLDPNETVEDCILRELKEETRINLPVRLLRDKLKHIRVFDAPDRSLRGRTVTHAGLFLLQGKEMPKVKGSDDAEVASWVPLASLDPGVMYEDHYDIIKALTGNL